MDFSSTAPGQPDNSLIARHRRTGIERNGSARRCDQIFWRRSLALPGHQVMVLYGSNLRLSLQAW
jgi:hypothetical protein